MAWQNLQQDILEEFNLSDESPSISDDVWRMLQWKREYTRRWNREHRFENKIKQREYRRRKGMKQRKLLSDVERKEAQSRWNRNWYQKNKEILRLKRRKPVVQKKSETTSTPCATQSCSTCRQVFNRKSYTGRIPKYCSVVCKNRRPRQIK